MAKKTNQQLQDEGNEFKVKRKLMGIKQVDLYDELNLTQGCLSKMENGRQNLGWRLLVIRIKYKKWRAQEIKRLTNHIKYLNSI